MALTSDSSTYEVVYGVALAVHIVTALVGFAMLALSGLYASWGSHVATAKDLHDVRQFFGPANWAGKTLWAVPFAGGVALWLNHGAAALGQAWAVAAAGCWAAATVVAVVVIWPAERRIRPVVIRLEETPVPESSLPGGDHLAMLCRPIVRAAALCDVMFTVALGLMILKPGR